MSENNMPRDSSVLEPGKRSRVLLIDEFDEALVGKEFRDFFRSKSPNDKDSRLYVYTPVHIGSRTRMGLFGDFAPSVVFASNKYNNTQLPFREKTLSEFAYSKLCHLYCTLDKSVMFGFFNRHMAMSKIHNLNSIAGILHRNDLILDVEEVLDDKKVSDDVIIEILGNVKRNATKLLREVRTDYDSSLHLAEEKRDLRYVGEIEKLFGANLEKILLYGSSARGEGNDYDNLVVLDNIPTDLYPKILGKGGDEAGKEVGIITIPKAQLDKFLYINVSNALFKRGSVALRGNFDFPEESERYQLWKELYHAGFGSAKLISAINLVFREPEILFDKPGLFEYFMKLNRFTLQGLMQQQEFFIPNKQSLLSILRNDFDYEIPEFRKDAEYLKKAFLKANKVSVDIAKKMYDPELSEERKEHLLVLKRTRAKKIFQANYRGQSVYVFGGREVLREGDVVPVRILTPGEEGHSHKRKEIKYRGIDHSGNYLVGKRV